MQTLTFHETVGDDGILRLQVPAQPHGARVEVVVVLHSETNGNGNGSAPKRPSVMDFAGTLTDETFEIPEDLPLGDILVIE